MAYKNIEAKKIYDRKWFRNNPEKRRKYEKAWREKNPYKVKQQKDRYYEKNKEYIKTKSNKYYYEVLIPKNKQEPEKYKEIVRIANQKKYVKRKALLLKLRQELGGKCTKCGYDREVNILQFHHHNKNKKDNVTNLQSLKDIQTEARKCVLLCPNCHATLHLIK